MPEVLAHGVDVATYDVFRETATQLKAGFVANWYVTEDPYWEQQRILLNREVLAVDPDDLDEVRQKTVEFAERIKELAALKSV